MFFRNVVGGVISKSSAVLQSLDERLNAEQEEADAYADFADLDDAARARFDQLVKTNKRLERMVVTLEQSLGDEQRVASETSAKLALAVGDRDTIDGLVDEYSKLSREAAGQAERDAATIADLLNKSEEQAMKLRLYERQIVSLSDAQSQEVRAFVGAGGAPDTARLFAALQGARAQNFELELEVEAAKRLAAPGPVDERLVELGDEVTAANKAAKASAAAADAAAHELGAFKASLDGTAKRLTDEKRAATDEATQLRGRVADLEAARAAAADDASALRASGAEAAAVAKGGQRAAADEVAHLRIERGEARAAQQAQFEELSILRASSAVELSVARVERLAALDDFNHAAAARAAGDAAGAALSANLAALRDAHADLEDEATALRASAKREGSDELDKVLAAHAEASAAGNAERRRLAEEVEALKNAATTAAESSDSRDSAEFEKLEQSHAAALKAAVDGLAAATAANDDLSARAADAAGASSASADAARAAAEAAEARQTALAEQHAVELVEARAADAALCADLEGRLAALQAETQAEVDARVLAATEKTDCAAADRFKAQIDAAHERCDEAERKATQERYRRKELHNKVMELQGNIRVVCRCRPPAAREGEREVAARFPNDEEIEVRRSEDVRDDFARFEFDAVFAPGSTQAAVFEAVEGLVTSVLDGYSVCIFAYGQTGSGKTHTMEGPASDRGVNFRAIAAIFDQAAEIDGVDYALEISILEIYNETIRDLLDSGAPGDRKKLEIHTASGQSVVPGLEQRRVRGTDDVERLIQQAAGQRTVGAHSMNAQSSRSHCILTLHVTATGREGAPRTAKLHLIDLAGSERVAKTDASGDRLKEAQAINKSLSALGDVIGALSSPKKAQHVPFRNSKLTFFLQDSLSGDSKALMFVNVSPSQSDAPETICSLKFAARCRDCALGQAKKSAPARLGPAQAASPPRPGGTPQSARARPGATR